MYSVSIPCFLTFYFSVATLAVIGYWSLVFKSSWILKTATFSIVYFSIRIISDILIGLVFTYFYRRSDKVFYLFSLEVICAIFEIWGLVSSIEFWNIDPKQSFFDEIIRTKLVCLFGVSLFSLSLLSVQKISEKYRPQTKSPEKDEFL